MYDHMHTPGRRTVAAPWAASSVQNGHLMQPFFVFVKGR